MQYCLIDTAIGTMGLGWTERGVARFALPGPDRASTERRMAKGGAVPGTPDAELVAKIIAYAEGKRVEFAGTALDLDGVPDFNRLVFDDILQLSWGETTSYGEIARRLGDVNLSRAVGRALGDNPIPLIIPCHRVVGRPVRVRVLRQSQRRVRPAKCRPTGRHPSDQVRGQALGGA
jgi:methylated-DNA-[protein]-cysteine S-methyltransferase